MSDITASLPVRRLETAFPDAEILYAVKANALGAVLSTLHESGAGLECASAGEVQRVLEPTEREDALRE